jgi:hypothetical protein
MFKLCDIRGARKSAKVSIEGAAKVIGANKNRIARIELDSGKAKLSELDALGTSYGFNICLLSDAEMEILRQLSVFCGKNEVKEGK